MSLKQIGLKWNLRKIKFFDCCDISPSEKRNDTEFLEYLTDSISNKLPNEKKTVVIPGNFNINLLNIDLDEYAEKFINLMLSIFPHHIYFSQTELFSIVSHR